MIYLSRKYLKIKIFHGGAPNVKVTWSPGDINTNMAVTRTIFGESSWHKNIEVGHM